MKVKCRTNKSTERPKIVVCAKSTKTVYGILKRDFS